MSLTKEQILHYIENPLELNDKTLDDLKGIVEEFPYFQSAHLLYVSNLLREKNYRFEGQLKSAAAHVTDRTVLYHLLNDYEIFIEKRSSAESESTEQVTENISDEIVSAISEGDLIELVEDPQKQSRESGTDVREEESSVLPADNKKDFISSDIIEAQTYQLEGADDVQNESMKSLITEINKNSRKKRDAEDEPPKKSKNDLIDRFISEAPVISSIDPGLRNTEDISEMSTRESDEFMTETLARIYVKQGYYQKAIKAFQKLSLKYPEKSTYFAGQIEEVSKLLNK